MEVLEDGEQSSSAVSNRNVAGGVAIDAMQELNQAIVLPQTGNSQVDPPEVTLPTNLHNPPAAIEEQGPNVNQVPLTEESVPVDGSVVNAPNESIASEDRIKLLEKTIHDLNADFGTKRAAFKELYINKEEELSKEREAKEELSLEIKSLQEELNEAKSQVTIAEFTKENEVEIEKNKYQHDLTSLRMRFEEKLKVIKTKYEDDIQQLKAANLKLESYSNEHISSGNSDGGAGGVLSAVTKSLARKLNHTASTSNDSLHEIEDSKAKPGKYAQEDAEMLRSLVVQLEEEISALKEKLRHSDDQLATLQGAQASIVKGNDALTVLLQGEDVQGVLTQFDDKLREARSGLEAEKSSRADLEMYVAFANAQKTLLQEELDKVKAQLRELRGCYELEKKKHEELKETWEKANEHFVTTHNEYKGVINNYREMLTAEQLESLKTKSSNDSQFFAQSTNTVDHASSGAEESVKSNVGNNSCTDCQKNASYAEKFRSDLLKAAKLRNEMEEEWSRISHDFQNQLGSLEEEIGTYEVVLLELNTSCQQSMEAIDCKVKRLAFDRESIQKKIEKLEAENDILKGKHVAHSHQLQNEYISLPNDIMELQEMVLRLKEELISVKVGKEQIEGELKFLKDQMQMIEEEKTSVEENLNAEISDFRDKVNDLNGRLFKADEERKRSEKNIMELKSKLVASETQLNKMHQLKTQNAELVKEKETLHNEIHELNNKVTTLRKELTNSEELQKDLIALSKSLQVNLESIRQAETEVRWQHPDDVSHCNSCRKTLSESKEKNHCKHCGRIFCTGCINRTVRRGNRDYNVCGICHTLLSHDSAPYFSTEPPHSPD